MRLYDCVSGSAWYISTTGHQGVERGAVELDVAEVAAHELDVAKPGALGASARSRLPARHARPLPPTPRRPEFGLKEADVARPAAASRIFIPGAIPARSSRRCVNGSCARTGGEWRVLILAGGAERIPRVRCGRGVAGVSRCHRGDRRLLRQRQSDARRARATERTRRRRGHCEVPASSPCRASSCSLMWKLRAIIASALFASRNARLRPGQKRGPAPNTSDLEAVASSSRSQRSGRIGRLVATGGWRGAKAKLAVCRPECGCRRSWCQWALPASAAD